MAHRINNFYLLVMWLYEWILREWFNSLSIYKIKNNIDITGCELHMYLPEGISVAKNSRNRYIYSFSRDDEHSTVFDPEALDGNGDQYVLIGMTGQYPLLDNDGELISITFKVDENIIKDEEKAEEIKAADDKLANLLGSMENKKWEPLGQ